MKQQPAHVRLPKYVASMLLPDEAVLLSVKQSRWKALFTPDTIVVTDQRIIRYSPSGFLGFRKDIEDYRYEDIANFKVKTGLFFATVTIGHRFMSENMVLDSLPKRSTTGISKAVEESIRRARGGVSSPSPAPPAPEDPLDILKMRFARGEITLTEYEEMKRTLE